jgi:hypothetical protein
VKAEWEVKPLGSSLDGTITEIDAQASDTGTSGVPLSHLKTGLLGDTPYHWRVRLHYDRITSPFAQVSRWLTVPWHGWQETMLRTGAAPVPAGRVPDGSTGSPLLLTKAALGQISLAWAVSCLETDTDYEVYEGTIGGTFTSHRAIFCSTGSGTTVSINPPAGGTYYLIVPKSSQREGSYGKTSAGVERPQGVSACLPQEIAGCP